MLRDESSKTWITLLFITSSQTGRMFFKRFTKQSSATVGIMDADQIDLGGKFSDESDSFVGWNSLREETGIRRTPQPRKTSIASKHCLAKISQNILLAYFVPTSCDILVWECGEERQSLNYANATRLLSSKPGLFNFPTYRST